MQSKLKHVFGYEPPVVAETKTGKWRFVHDWHCSYDGTEFTVPSGFKTDGASIPSLLRPFFGSPMKKPRVYVAIIHDWLYEVGGTEKDREFADKMYRDANICLGMGKIKAELEYHGIRLFGWRHWKYDLGGDK